MMTLTPDQERKIKTLAEQKQKSAEAILDDLLARETEEAADLAAYVAQKRAIQQEKTNRRGN